MKTTMTGTISEIGEIQTWDSGFSKREFRIDASTGEYPNPLAFQLKKEKSSLTDGLAVGQRVEVSFYINGREHNGRVYIDLDAFKVSALDVAPAVAHEDVITPTTAF